ncbi:D-allose-binding periplasmic protein precursor [Anaerobiospirillum thomasii]|uniref:D-allose transporter substrate-binding protein n=1 Tax=Anaerobiospirillum thomasii TaxID=179995 RepID=UPI000D86AAB7|nr:D-allose transporter substrate-binding protein [Anaerobiospirillum thomasii]SPT71649.1 D-allose-binding periplasmic protein precursor [Anaerobiospirillum thomasii]
MKKGAKFVVSLLAASVLSLGSVSTATAADAEYAVVLKVLSSEFWQTMKDGVEKEAEKQGIKVDVYAANTEDDVEGQTTLMENAVNKGYKGIAFAPISPDNLNPAIAEATSRNIPVVNIDEIVNLDGLNALGGKVYALVATDNQDVGRMGAQYIIDQIGGKGKVAIIEGKAGTKSGEDRRQGATDAFKAAAPGIELVESQPADWDRTRAYDIATNYLNKYPDLKGIYACNDTMAMGALAAVNASGKKVIVVGTDGNSDAVESVKNGELGATVRQRPDEIGARGVQLLIEAVNAKAMPETPKQEMIKAELVVKD